MPLLCLIRTHNRIQQHQLLTNDTVVPVYPGIQNIENTEIDDAFQQIPGIKEARWTPDNCGFDLQKQREAVKKFTEATHKDTLHHDLWLIFQQVSSIHY
jgi:hypothetical protein